MIKRPLGSRMTTVWNNLVFVWVSSFLFSTIMTVRGNPTCYEYHDAECQTGVRNTYHALTGGNCSRTYEGNTPPLGTACLTTATVALTEVEPITCRKTFGSVQTVSQCLPLGQRDGQDLWIYCTDSGCDEFGNTCTAAELEVAGQALVWNSCVDSQPAISSPVLADGTCTALPMFGASMRLSCINNLYMQAELFHDLACTQPANYLKAPSFLQTGQSCYQYQGSTKAFEMTVEQGCTCSNHVEPPDTTDTGDKYAPSVPRLDVVYNITVNRTHCLDGSGMTDLQEGIEIQTNAQVAIAVGAASLITDGVLSYWNMNMELRFVAIPEPEIATFTQDLDSAMGDGRMLAIVQATCGGVGNITMENHWSVVSDHVAPQDSSSAAARMWGSISDSFFWGVLLMIPVLVVDFWV